MSHILDKYNIKIGEFEVRVNIVGVERPNEYHIELPEVQQATSAILGSIKKELISEINLSFSELTDPRALNALKTRTAERLEKLIIAKFPNIDDEQKSYFNIMLMNEMLGLEQIEILLEDSNLEEVIIHKVNHPIMVYHKQHGWLKTNLTIKDENKIRNYASILARRVGKQITTLTPLLDANMLSGDRANAVLYPISHTGNTITIRKFARDPWTIISFIKNKTITAEAAALIWVAIQYEMNIIISGGTASGKTSLLNVSLAFMPTNQRIISIEDTRELQVPDTLFYLPLITRTAGIEGEGKISMQNLLVNSLRMRPDRIILGEIRKGEDAQVLFEAMHTGHSVCATVHADSAHETIRRLTNPPINVPSNLLDAVSLNVVMFRDRRRNIRRCFQISEYIVEENGHVKTNIIQRWNPADDTLRPHLEPVKFFENLSKHTSLSIEEIKEDLADKTRILNWMVKENMASIGDIGKTFKDYYENPKKVIEMVK